MGPSDHRIAEEAASWVMRLSRMERAAAGHLRAWLSAEAENIAIQHALERQGRKSGMLLALAR